MKFNRLFSAILAAVMCIAFSSANVFAANADKVVDMAGVLDDAEEQKLEEKLLGIVDEYGYDIAVVTVESTDGESMMDYADDYYDYNYYGEDGLMLLYNSSTNEAYITTDGKGIRAFTDKGIDALGKEVRTLLNSGKYYKAFEVFVDTSEEYIDQYETTGKPVNPKNYIMIAIISFGIGLLIAAIVCFALKSQLTTAVKQTSAKAYVRSGSRNVTYARDIYLYKKVTRHKIESNNGSSTHRSSSGDTHGGGSI
ncbi:MAG: TPM domain-containing protein [Oscillospiraceae bacterium]|nr:TPM domain-containing protein [Oscillospiraceae bacterium]